MTPFGLTATQLDSVLSVLRRHLGPSETWKAWVFGSRARGTQRPYSDLDLLIERTPALSSNEKARLAEDFEESDLPFKVDLVLTEELLDAYRDSVLAERRALGE